MVLEAVEDDRFASSDPKVGTRCGPEVSAVEAAEDKHNRGSPVIAVAVLLGHCVHVDLDRRASK